MNFFDDIRLFDSSTAIITEDREHITYNTLINEADKIKQAIDGRCLVFCVCRNSLESVVGYIGFLRGRMVPVMISDSLNMELFDSLLRKYRPKYIWISNKQAPHIKDADVMYTFKQYVLLKTHDSVDYGVNDELALLLTTSGSTGSPKLVRQSYNNIISNAQAIAQYLQITPEDRPITTMPMSYTYGLSIINSHLLKGASMIMTDKTLMDKAFWSLIREEKATTFGGVPYIYEMLKKLRFEKMDLPSIRVLTQAGGKLSLELTKEFANVCRNKGIRFFVMYGQTEATARMAYLPYQYAWEKAGSMGIAIPGGELYLEDSEGSLIAGSETVGELIYKGDNVTLGYAESYRDLEKDNENNGVLRTGDMAKRDNDGFYYIVGRKKRFLKLFGNRINLDEVESMLKSQGYDCACAGEDDHMRIYTTDQRNAQDIKRFVAEYTGINPVGYEILYIDAIPHNEAGKILYSQL